MFAQIIFKMANIGLREDRGLREQRGLRELSGLKLILARMMFVVHCFCAAEPMQPFFAAPARRLLISGSRTGLLISGSRTGLLARALVGGFFRKWLVSFLSAAYYFRLNCCMLLVYNLKFFI